MAKKKMVEDQLSAYLDIFSFEGDIDKVIEKLAVIRDLAIEEGYSDVRIANIPNRWDDFDDIFVFGKRLETDLELNKRVRKQKKQKEANEKRKATNKQSRRKQYEKLRREFEEHANE